MLRWDHCETYEENRRVVKLNSIVTSFFSSLRYKTMPPFYRVRDDTFYHGPAWVIKPRLFQPNGEPDERPGPAHYSIPERSIYARPGEQQFFVTPTG